MKEKARIRQFIEHEPSNHNSTAYLSIDILQHDVLGFKVSVYDLVFVQILDPRAWSRKHQIYSMITLQNTRLTEEGKHWTYQHRWVKKALHSLSNRSSFQVCSTSGTHAQTTLYTCTDSIYGCSTVTRHRNALNNDCLINYICLLKTHSGFRF